jgi:hypothetical protein
MRRSVVAAQPGPGRLKGASALPITETMSIETTLARVVAIQQALADPAVMVGAGGVPTGGTEAPAAPAGEGETSFASALAQAAGAGATATQASPTTGAAALAGSSGAGLAASAAIPASTALPGSSALPGSTALPVSYAPQGVAGVDGLSALSPLQYGAAESPGSRIVAIAESQLGQTEQPPGSNESPAIAMYRGATAGAIPGAPWCAYFASWVARQAGEPIGEGGQGAGAVSAVWSWAQSTGRAIPNGPGVVPQAGDLIVFGDEHVGIVRDVLPDGQIQTIEGNYENKVAANVRSPTEATGYVNMS